jgi:hypothetical protein
MAAALATASPRAIGLTPREAALAVLERASRPFAVYCIRSGNDFTVVAELSQSSIQAGRWKEGADVEAVASDADGRLLGRGQGALMRALMRRRYGCRSRAAARRRTCR